MCWAAFWTATLVLQLEAWQKARTNISWGFEKVQLSWLSSWTAPFVQPLPQPWWRLRPWNCRGTTSYCAWAKSTLTRLHTTVWTGHITYLTQRETCRTWTGTWLNFPCCCRLLWLYLLWPQWVSSWNLVKKTITAAFNLFIYFNKITNRYLESKLNHNFFSKVFKFLRIRDTLTEIVIGRLKEPRQPSVA